MLKRYLQYRPAFIKPAFDTLAQTLPHTRRAVFPGLDHIGSSDPGPSQATTPPQRIGPVGGFTDQTIRQKVRVSSGGSRVRVRIRLSSLSGIKPLQATTAE